MLAPRTRWRFPEPIPLDDALIAAGARHDLGVRVTALLAARGVTDAAALESFIGEPRSGLHDPASLPDAAVFRDRIVRARERGEPVLAFGDFDADGITGLAILTLSLRRLGVTVVPYVPSRLDEGHGLSLAAVEAASAAGAGVIVTVDTGTSSAAEVAAANERGIDVLVTDHHRVPPTLPPAVAIVNPHRPDGRYPERRLAGSGVAFTLARLLLGDAALAFVDLAAIGTVADLAPVLGENRAIVRLGLERIRADPRPGLRALLAAARIEPGDVDLETLAFAVAPRLNAAGRVGEAFDAAALLLADDPVEAERLAARLESANATRRELMRDAIAAARTSPDAVGDAAATIVRGPWPVGIVGLVASRLVEERGRPAIVGAELGAVIRASCRSDGRLHLADTLAECEDLLLRHGGHGGAAGFEIATDQWPVFRDRFLSLVGEPPPGDVTPESTIDVAVPALGVDYALQRDLARLGPCGIGNPEPLVAVLGLTVMRVREANGGHTTLVLRRERDVLDGVAFGWPELAAMVREGDRIDVVGALRSRRFGGFESLQLEIRDAAPSGYHAEARAILEGPVAVGPGVSGGAPARTGATMPG